MNALTRLLCLGRLAMRYTADFWISNFVIAGKVLSRRPDIHPGIVMIPTRVESPAEILAMSNLISFTPGTLLLPAEPGKYLEVHALDDRGPVAASITENLEEPLLQITRGEIHHEARHDD